MMNFTPAGLVQMAEELKRAEVLAEAVHKYLWGSRTDAQRHLMARALEHYMGQVPNE